MRETTTPPGWPKGLPPPEVEAWEQEAVVWLLDTGPSHYRQDVLLRAQPVVLARRVVEVLEAEVEASRRAWVPLASWERTGLPAEAHEPVLTMRRQVGLVRGLVPGGPAAQRRSHPGCPDR